MTMSNSPPQVAPFRSVADAAYKAAYADAKVAALAKAIIAAEAAFFDSLAAATDADSKVVAFDNADSLAFVAAFAGAATDADAKVAAEAAFFDSLAATTDADSKVVAFDNADSLEFVAAFASVALRIAYAYDAVLAVAYAAARSAYNAHSVEE
jgi:hypothetical protein